MAKLTLCNASWAKSPTANPFIANLLAGTLPSYELAISLDHGRLGDEVFRTEPSAADPLVANLVARALSSNKFAGSSGGEGESCHEREDGKLHDAVCEGISIVWR